MNIINTLFSVRLAISLTLFANAFASNADAADKPNFVVILTHDQS